MTDLSRFPALNNRWMTLKHGIRHRLRRRGRERRSATVERPHNVLLVVVDCLRSDHVSGFGHDRPTTPTLDDVEAARFPDTVAPAPWTFPSVPSLLSGRYPNNHGGGFDRDPRNLSAEQFPTRPDPSIPMLPDVLEGAGYDTGLVTAIPMTEEAVGSRFDSVDVAYTDADERVARALSWLDGRDRWFLHLHLGDPHAPLDVPERHREAFDVPDRPDLADWRYRESIEGEGFEAYRAARRRAYDAAVRGADDALAHLFDRLDDDTLVVVCGDHGEAFWEHPELERRLNEDPRGYYGTDHGHSLFEETVRVPLWIRAPTLDAGTYGERASLVDVVPTLAAALGLDAEFDPDGVPLPPEGTRTVRSEELAYGYDQVAVWRGDRKLIRSPGLGAELAFDLATDPGERDPLAEPPAPLREAADRAGDGGIDGGDRVDVDEDTRDRLAELGYLE